MRRVSNGYTVLEVMIVLAVSTLLIASAWALIDGRQEKTNFDQKMRETQSKLQQWMSDVSTGVTNGNPSQQTCTPQPISGITRPLIKNTAPTSSYAPQCTFLGKAIQFTDKSWTSSPQDSNLYVYSVFGCRLVHCSSSTGILSQDVLPQDMYSANPEPAIGQNVSGTPYADLTETFSLSPAYVFSVCALSGGSCGGGTQSHMIGFMNNFNTGDNTSVNGSEDLKVYQYALNNNYYPANDLVNGANVVNCLEGLAPCIPALATATPDPPILQSYQICLTDGKSLARIIISSVNGVGASTQLDYGIDTTQC